MKAAVSWWCDRAKHSPGLHGTCARFGVGKGVPCSCRCHTDNDG